MVTGSYAHSTSISFPVGFSMIVPGPTFPYLRIFSMNRKNLLDLLSLIVVHLPALSNLKLLHIFPAPWLLPQHCDVTRVLIRMPHLWPISSGEGAESVFVIPLSNRSKGALHSFIHSIQSHNFPYHSLQHTVRDYQGVVCLPGSTFNPPSLMPAGEIVTVTQQIIPLSSLLQGSTRIIGNLPISRGINR